MKDTSEDITRMLASTGGRKRWRWRLLPVLALLLAGGWIWIARQDGTGVGYVTEAARRGALTVTVTATGTVQPTTEVEVSSELSGTIAAVEVDYNDEVEVGQVLARLDDTKLMALLANAEASLAAAKGRLTQAGATAREAEENFLSQQALDQRGVSAHRDLVAYAAAHERAQAAVLIATADLTLAEANLRLQRADFEKATIRSPVKGIVLDRAAEAGQIVASSLNAPVLFTLAEDLDRMELQVDIDEADIGRVALGNTAEFRVDAYPGRSFPARIVQVRFAPEATEGVVTYKAVLTVDNAARLLRPGMTATATITVAQVTDALLVPNAALRYAPPQVTQQGGTSGGGLLGLIMPRPPASGVAAPAGRTIWVLRGDETVEVPVTPGETDGKWTAVVSEELEPGDAIITDQTEAE